MRESFYRYLMTKRDPNGIDEISHFANAKHSLIKLFLNIRMIIMRSRIILN